MPKDTREAVTQGWRLGVRDLTRNLIGKGSFWALAALIALAVLYGVWWKVSTSVTAPFKAGYEAVKNAPGKAWRWSKCKVVTCEVEGGRVKVKVKQPPPPSTPKQPNESDATEKKSSYWCKGTFGRGWGC